MLILWSGGCDSTLCLLDAAKLSPVRAIAIEHPNFPAREEQAKARTGLLKAIQPRCEPISVSTLVITRPEQKFDCVSAGGIMQACMWITNAQIHLLENEDLCVGYIRGDDIWHYRQTLVEMYERLRCITHKTGNLTFPLEWTNKAGVIRRLRDEAILDLCWYCESPRDGIACGHCMSCLTHRTGLAQMEIEDTPIPGEKPMATKKPAARAAKTAKKSPKRKAAAKK